LSWFDGVLLKISDEHFGKIILPSSSSVEPLLMRQIAMLIDVEQFSSDSITNGYIQNSLRSVITRMLNLRHKEHKLIESN
jgi:hypothetical protein